MTLEFSSSLHGWVACQVPVFSVLPKFQTVAARLFTPCILERHTIEVSGRTMCSIPSTMDRLHLLLSDPDEPYQPSFRAVGKLEKDNRRTVHDSLSAKDK
jgi:hypothetical protein